MSTMAGGFGGSIRHSDREAVNLHLRDLGVFARAEPPVYSPILKSSTSSYRTSGRCFLRTFAKKPPPKRSVRFLVRAKVPDSFWPSFTNDKSCYK